MQQNSFVVSTKHFVISIKFWLLEQNVLSGQQKKFCCINFFLSAYSSSIQTLSKILSFKDQSREFLYLDVFLNKVYTGLLQLCIYENSKDPYI